VDGVNQRFDFRAPVPGVGELGAVHFIAIGGAGMSAVARIMLARGVRVSGSDARDSVLLEALGREGAQVWVGHDAGHVAAAHTVVVSSAVREDNIELAAARASGLRVLHRAQALAATMQDSVRVAVAGANGKTTTTSMLTVALQHSGADPSFAIGGELAAAGTNARWGSGGLFVAEADESDGSFLVYRPRVAVVTNVQPDHLDFYGTFARVQEAYADFARSVEPGGLLVACHDDAGSRGLAERARAEGVRVMTYGVEPGADLRLESGGSEGLSAAARLRDGATARGLRIGTPGGHNLLNAAAAYTAAVHGLGQAPDAVLQGLGAFTGTRRRFELKGVARGVTVIDDYAHNPGKVAAVVRTAAELAAGARLLVVFQPHLFSRTRDFAEAFAEALAPADTVVLMDIYGAREDPMPGVTSDLIAKPLHAVRPDLDLVVRPASEEVASLVAERAVEGDLVLTVGAGDVTALGPAILHALDGDVAG
jgi:UDP-N-acetylmuramate--alanine ligase